MAAATTALALAALGAAGTAQAPLPDQLDVFRGSNRRPNIVIMVDLSSSMITDYDANPRCQYYLLNRGNNLQFQSLRFNWNTGVAYNVPLPPGALPRIDQVIASLTGCESPSDGIFDRFASSAIIALGGFQGTDAASQLNSTFGLPYVVNGQVVVGAHVPMSTPIYVPFDTSGGVRTQSNVSVLEAAALNLSVPLQAGTPLMFAYDAAADHFRTLDDTTTLNCRPNAVVLMTDGVGNSTFESLFPQLNLGPVNFNQVSGQPSLNVNDSGRCYVPTVLGDGVTMAPGASNGGDCSISGANPPHGDVVARYLYGDPNSPSGYNDAVSTVSGTQPIRTYTIGFQVPDLGAEQLLADMATVGGGIYVPASNSDALYNAFESIMANIRSQASATFRGITLQGSGFTSGNYAYQNSFQGYERGHWFGNYKKFCIYPSSQTDDTCLLIWDSALGDYVLNPNPRDEWTQTRGYQTRQGGAGAVLQARYPGNATPSATPPTGASAYSYRNIMTWDPAGSRYIQVSPYQSGFDQNFTESSNLCAHYALINKLYGYTYDVTQGCVTSPSPNPVAYDYWPLADTINGGQVVLKYSASCESGGDRCYLVTVSNAGMLHIFNAVTGEEEQALIPPMMFRRNAAVNERLRNLMNQPTLEKTRRYYFDGGLSVYHQDQNANGYIDGSEPAYLVAGLGRGGAGYIRWPVTTLGAGGFDSNNPPQPLLLDHGNGFRNLRDSWAAPWLGDIEIDYNGGGITKVPVAVFPSGHVADLDRPRATLGTMPQRVLTVADDPNSPLSVGCAQLNIPSSVCQSPTLYDICIEILGSGAPECGARGQTCDPCTSPNIANCQTGRTPCYDWPGYRAAFNAALAAGLSPNLSQYGITGLSPYRVQAGPFRYEETDGSGNVIARGIAYRLQLNIDLQPGDRFVIYDDSGNVVQSWQGAAGQVTSSWIRSSNFSFEVVGDGVNNGTNLGYQIRGIDVIRDNVPGQEQRFNEHPSIWIVDMNRWNGSSGPVDYSPAPMPTGYQRPGTQLDATDAVLVRVTDSCVEGTGANETCIDQTTFPDLRHMTCPITAEPAVYTEGGVLRSIYVGDECGQIWAITQSADRTGWDVRRLLSTNVPSGGSPPIGESKDFRKIFTKLDLVISTCTGRRAIGVYFGTGNVQRPVDRNLPNNQPENLTNTAITRFPNTQSGRQRDVIGVVWDAVDPATGLNVSNLTLADLSNVSSVANVDPRSGSAQQGFFIELRPFEKALRSPVVLDGFANFQTYEPLTSSNECSDASGESRVYRFDNCTAAPPTGSSPADRVVAYNPTSNIGGDMIVLVPPADMAGMTANAGRGAMVMSGDMSGSASARADLSGGTNRAVRLYLWRIDTE